MLISNSKKSGLHWAVFCLIFIFLFFFVACVSTSFACDKKCASKSGSHKCDLPSEATSENSGDPQEHQQKASNPQSTQKQPEPSGPESQTTVTPATAKFTVKERYSCSMHPEVMKTKAGKCPKCGMNLEKKEFYEVYACPMADCPYLSEKSGKCSTCGMKLKKKLLSKEEYQNLIPPQITYTCPMHPEVSPDKPGNCPKCGMKLEMKGPTSKE
jgi:hypothetical protein